jgi:DNA-binding winged helix-turn-helix (wHTH) protein/TolB-like protein
MGSAVPTHKESLSRVAIGTCAYDPVRGELLDGNGRPVHLRPRAMQALQYLLAHAGRLVSRDELMAAVWPGVIVTDDSLVQCIGDIRRALGEAGHQLLKTVPRRGYRLEVGAPPVASRSPRPRLLAIALIALAVVVLGGLAGVEGMAWFAERRARASPAGEAALAVLPTQCDAAAPGASLHALQLNQGYALELAADLAHNSDARLVAAAAVFAASHGRDLPPQELAQQLGVRYVLNVCAQVDGAGLNQAVELVDASNGRRLWKEVVHSSLERLPAGRASLLRRIADGLHANLRFGDNTPVLWAPPRSIESYVLVTRAAAAIARFDRDEYRSASEDLAQVRKREPGYAAAWALAGALGAADNWAHVSGDLPAAREREVLALLERAIALDQRMALPHQALSLALVSAGRRPEGLAAAQRALELAPGDPAGPVVLANALLGVGRMQEAMLAIDQAQPRWRSATSDFDYVRAKALWGVDRLEESMAAASRCIERTPQFAACHGVRALAGDAMGRLEATRRDLKAYRDAVPGELPQGPGSYPGKDAPKLLSDWLKPIQRELGLL